MDKAQQLELEVLGRQKFMNAVIEEYNSPIQQFFCGATIFLTGGTGFLGKHLIEKLIRACKIKKIFLLLRSKKGKTIQERLDFMLKDPVYDLLREKQPNFASLLEAVEGDVSEIQLGLSTTEYAKISEQVEFIFHLAATVRFDGPLKTAALTNVRGTRECLTLAKACKNLQFFTHVSTAFTHATVDRTGTKVEEQFYPCPMPPDVIIEMVENVEDKRLEDITEGLIHGWPNTYTFTKAIAEEEVRINSGDLPICVVRPPVVLPACQEPYPGWCDISSLYGPSGIIIGIGLGVLHVFPVEVHNRLNLMPVDYVNNGIIAATWDAFERKKNGDVTKIPLYNISASKRGLVWEFIATIMRSQECRMIGTPLAVWYCYLVEVTNPILYWILTCLLHYIPAYVGDAVCKVLGIKIKGVSSFRHLYHKYYKMSKVFNFFVNHEFYFDDEKFTDMICRMSKKDRDIFNCDIYTIDYGQFVRTTALGLRKYILKDGLKNSADAYKKQKWFYIANIIYLASVAYVIYCVFYFCFTGVKYTLF